MSFRPCGQGATGVAAGKLDGSRAHRRDYQGCVEGGGPVTGDGSAKNRNARLRLELCLGERRAEVRQ